MLGCGVWLMVGWPFRAAWQRLRLLGRVGTSTCRWLLSLNWMLSACTFLTQVAHPVVYLWGGGSAPGQPGWLWQALGVVGMLWDTGLLLGFLLLTMRRWTLPLGALTFVIGLNAVAMGFLYRGAYPFLPVMARAVAAWGPRRCTPGSTRRCSVSGPGVSLRTVCLVLLTTLHFGALGLTVGVWWSVHLWAGAIVLTGLSVCWSACCSCPRPGQATHRTADTQNSDGHHPGLRVTPQRRPPGEPVHVAL